MPATEPTLPTLSDFLSAPLRVGEPDVHGPLAVFPLFGPPAVAEYVAFADGCARGLLVKELDAGASVNDLVVLNPTDADVLLYEGEEVLGAQQNRTFDVSVLVGAGTSVRVPVSCVEHGRWDGSRHGEAFAPAVLDHVSRPDAFAALHGPLVQGYALDALEAAADGAPPAPPALDEARAFVAELAGTRITQHDGIGLGRDARFTRAGVTGAGVLAGEELVQLTAFADGAGRVGRRS